MTATLSPAVPIRIACPSCGSVAEVRRGPRGLVLACGGCREREDVTFENVLPLRVAACVVCCERTDGRFAHEDCLRKKGMVR